MSIPSIYKSSLKEKERGKKKRVLASESTLLCLKITPYAPRPLLQRRTGIKRRTTRNAHALHLVSAKRVGKNTARGHAAGAPRQAEREDVGADLLAVCGAGPVVEAVYVVASAVSEGDKRLENCICC